MFIILFILLISSAFFHIIFFISCNIKIKNYTSILDPVSWLARGDNPIWWSLGYSGTLVIDVRSSVRGTLKELDNSSIDFYAALRSAYRQNRNELISNGKNDYQNEEYDFD